MKPTLDATRHAAASAIVQVAERWDQILRRDWTGIVLAIGARVGRDNISMLAAGVAFYVFVAIPSGLAAIVSLYSLLFNPEQVETHAMWFVGILPLDVINLLTNFLQLLATKPQSALGIRLFLGLLVALWSAQSASSSMITALNAVYEKRETRSYLRFQLAALILAFCSIVFGLASLLLLAVAPFALTWIPWLAGTLSVLRWPALAVLVALAIAGIYRFAPAGKSSERQWGAWGVALTTVVWVGSSALFALYVGNVASYDSSYGSLGAVVVLLLWLYIAVFVVLLGAELNAEMEKRTSRE